MSNQLKRIGWWLKNMALMPARMEDLRVAVGRIERRQTALLDSNNIHANEFKVFSQTGEDGIIQFLLRHVDVPNRVFVEFGVHDYTESNTRFLLENNRWSGLVMDGSAKAVEQIRNDSIYWLHNLKTECAFIDRDNINGLIRKNGIKGDIGILSIDIDGNDYWVWDAIDCVKPRIVICEYNSLFGPFQRVTSLYDKSFVITQVHYSGLYWGASIGAFHYLARKKGYSLVGSNTAGNNIFFVRDDIVGSLRTYSPEQAYVQSQFRISRDPQGNLSYLDSDDSLRLIADMQLYEVDTGRMIRVADLGISGHVAVTA
jgi:hypothetical protein